MLLHGVVEYLRKVLYVLLVDELVAVDALRLVHPQPDEVDRLLEALVRAEQEALMDSPREQTNKQ